jgi:hypothetical protein
MLKEEVRMINKKATKKNYKDFSWRGIRWQLIDHGKSLNTIQKTGAAADFRISDMELEVLNKEISENVSLMAQFFANDSLGG